MIVSGTIRNDDNETLPGATVFVSDSKGNLLAGGAGVNADENGLYSINVDTSQYLTFRLIGYAPQTFKPERANQDVQLSIATATIPGVTITATRIFKKINWPPILTIAGITALSFLGIFFSVKTKK